MHTRDARGLCIKDVVGVGWMFSSVCGWAVLGSFLWKEDKISNLYHVPSGTGYQFGGFVWYELSMIMTTWIFSWWWLRLKTDNVKSAFVFAIGGWAITRAILSSYRSSGVIGFDFVSIDVNVEDALVIVAALAVLVVLMAEAIGRIKAANVIVFILVLLLIVPQILETHFIDAIYIMIIPSVAIANWVEKSRPVMVVTSDRAKIVSTLALAGSVAGAVVISGIVPLMIIGPNRATGIDLNQIVILHSAAWTAPFIGSTVAYIVIKRISNDPVVMEWATVAWLILNYLAAFWSSTINIELSDLANLEDAFLGIGVGLSLGIGALAVGVLVSSLLLGRGTVVRPLFAASIWLAVLYAMTPLLAYSETPQVLKVMYSFELALTLTMVFLITSRVFGGDPSKKVVASAV